LASKSTEKKDIKYTSSVEKNIALKFYHIPQKIKVVLFQSPPWLFAIGYEDRKAIIFIIIFIINYYNMKNINSITCQLLNCWYLDVEFLDNLLDEYNIDIDIDDIKISYWEVNDINIIIYEAYSQIKEMFLSENQEEIKSLGYNIEDFEAWKDFEIYTNYLDSHLWFNNPDIDNIYQNWGKH
jgi:hypothetical protein